MSETASVTPDPSVVDLAGSPAATPFRLRAQLLDAGSKTDMLARTDNLWIQIRVYAAHGGENAMHAHHYQDHSFIVLQGNARFRGPRGEVWNLGRNEGIMLPSGAYYCFENSGDDALVVLRIASKTKEEGDPGVRLGTHGGQIDAHTPENNRPEIRVFRSGAFYE